MALKDNLIHSWNFNDNLNDLIGSNNGTGNNITYTKSPSGRAVKFNGTSAYIDVGNFSTLGNYFDSNPFSFRIRLKWSHSNSWSCIFGGDNSGSNGAGDDFSVFLNRRGDTAASSSGDISFFIDGDTTIAGGTVGAGLNDGKWHEIIITQPQTSFSQSDMAMYIDGEEVTLSFWDSDTVSSFTDDLENVYIGARGITGSEAFSEVEIDLLDLFNVELTAANVSDFWNGGFFLYYDNTSSDYIESDKIPYVLEGLEACYNFDDNLKDIIGGFDLTHSGTATYDTGKKGNALTLNGNYAENTAFNKDVLSFGGWIYAPNGITSSTSANKAVTFRDPTVTSALRQDLLLGNNSGYCVDETITLTKEESNGVYDHTYIKDNLAVGWNHVWFNWNSGNNKYDIYINGVKKVTYESSDSDAGNCSVFDDTLMLQFGDITEGSYSSEDLRYDSWFFYSEAKSEALITELYNSGQGKFLEPPELSTDSDITTNLLHFYSLNGHIRDLIGTWHGDVVGGFGIETGLNQDYSYSPDGDNQRVDFDGDLDIDGFNHSVSFWFKDGLEANKLVFSGATATVYKGITAISVRSDGSIYVGLGDGTTNRNSFQSAAGTVSANTKTHIVVIVKTITSLELYVNGVSTTISLFSEGISSMDWVAEYNLSYYLYDGSYVHTDNLEQLAIYEAAITSTVINKLYNSGNGLTPIQDDYELVEDLNTGSVSISATVGDNISLSIGATETASVLVAAQTTLVADLTRKVNGNISISAISGKLANLTLLQHGSASISATAQSIANLKRVWFGSTNISATVQSFASLRLVKLADIAIGAITGSNVFLSLGAEESGSVSLTPFVNSNTNLTIRHHGSVGINASVGNNVTLDTGNIEQGSVSVSAVTGHTVMLNTGSVEQGSVSVSAVTNYFAGLSTGEEEYGRVSISGAISSNVSLSSGAIEEGSVNIAARVVVNPIKGSVSVGTSVENNVNLSRYYQGYKVSNYKSKTMVGGPGWMVGDILVARLVDYDKHGSQKTIYKLRAMVLSIIREGYYLLTIQGSDKDWEIFEEYSKEIKFVRSGNFLNSERSNYVVFSADDWHTGAHNPHITGYINVDEYDKIDAEEKMIYKLGNLFGVDNPAYTGHNEVAVSFNQVGFSVLEDSNSRPTLSSDYEWENSTDRHIPADIYDLGNGYYLHICYADTPHYEFYFGGEEEGANKDYIFIGISDEETYCEYFDCFNFDQMIATSNNVGIYLNNENLITNEWYLYIAYRNLGSPDSIYDNWQFSGSRWTGDRYGVVVYGDMYVGDREGTKYIKFDKDAGTFDISANLNILNADSINIMSFSGASAISNNALAIDGLEDDVSYNLAQINIQSDKITNLVQALSASDSIGYIRSTYDGGTYTRVNIYNDSGNSIEIKAGDRFEIIDDDVEAGVTRNIVTASVDKILPTGSTYFDISSASITASYGSGVRILGVTHQSRITQTAEEIRIEVQDVEDGLQSQISVNADNISLKVSTADLEESSSIVIHPSNIVITGDTTFEDSVDIKGSMEIGTTNKLWLNTDNAGDLAIGGSVKTTAPFRVTPTGKLYGTDVEISGKITGSNIEGSTLETEGGTYGKMFFYQDEIRFLDNSDSQIGKLMFYDDFLGYDGFALLESNRLRNLEFAAPYIGARQFIYCSGESSFPVQDVPSSDKGKTDTFTSADGKTITVKGGIITGIS